MNNLISALNAESISMVNDIIFELGRVLMISVLGIKVWCVSYGLISGRGVSKIQIKEVTDMALCYIGYMLFPEVLCAIRYMMGL